MVVAAQGGPVPAARKRSAKWNDHRDETRDPRTARVAAYLQTPTEQGLPHKGYRDMPATPLFAFGHGLSYTTFDYSNLTLSNTTVDIGSIEIGVAVESTAAATGDEVVQVYFSDTATGLTRPAQEFIRASAGVHARPGAARTVTFWCTWIGSATSDSTVTLLIRRSQVRSLPGAL